MVGRADEPCAHDVDRFGDWAIRGRQVSAPFPGVLAGLRQPLPGDPTPAREPARNDRGTAEEPGTRSPGLDRLGHGPRVEAMLEHVPLPKDVAQVLRPSVSVATAAHDEAALLRGSGHMLLPPESVYVGE